MIWCVPLSAGVVLLPGVPGHSFTHCRSSQCCHVFLHIHAYSVGTATTSAASPCGYSRPQHSVASTTRSHAGAQHVPQAPSMPLSSTVAHIACRHSKHNCTHCHVCCCKVLPNPARPQPLEHVQGQDCCTTSRPANLPLSSLRCPSVQKCALLQYLLVTAVGGWHQGRQRHKSQASRTPLGVQAAPSDQTGSYQMCTRTASCDPHPVWGHKRMSSTDSVSVVLRPVVESSQHYHMYPYLLSLSVPLREVQKVQVGAGSSSYLVVQATHARRAPPQGTARHPSGCSSMRRLPVHCRRLTVLLPFRPPGSPLHPHMGVMVP
jgi:hypothetical protein